MYDNGESKNYKYDAFISYRHTELDRFIAEKIQKYLEEFKLPKNVKKKKGLNKTKIERVFRDKEELTITNNLEDPIIQALKGSEYLIVICSPRIKESVWCRKEIETFIKFHGRNKILTVLIEGEPEDSFPEELLYEEEKVVVNGVETIRRKEIEPLAADIRAASRRRMCSLLKTELLRVIAPIFGLEYDDLRQRHRERKVKRVLTATMSAAGLGLAVGIAGVTSALIINNQKAEIASQNEKLLLNQAENLSNKSLEYLEQDRRMDAISTALSSLTNYEGIDMPYTAKGRYVLTQALRVYDIGGTNKANNQFKTQANIMNMELSPSKQYVMAVDKADNLYVWDIATGRLVIEVDKCDSNICFVGDSMVAYFNKDGKLVVRGAGDNKEKVIAEQTTDISSFNGNATGSYLAVTGREAVVVYDTANGDVVYQTEKKEGVEIVSDLIWCEDKLVYVEQDGDDFKLKLADWRMRRDVYSEINFDSIDSAVRLGDYIYVMGNVVGENIMEGYGVIVAVDTTNGEIAWEKKIDDKYINDFDVIGSEEEGYVVFSSYEYLVCLDASNGDEYNSFAVSDGIRDFWIDKKGNGQLINAEGRVISFNVHTNVTLGIDYYLECNITKIDNIKFCYGGVIALPMISNCLITYSEMENQDMEAYTPDEELRDFIAGLWSMFEDCTEEAAELGLPNSDMIASIVYIDENVVAATYLDLTMEIYDIAQKKILKSYTDVECAPVKCIKDEKEGCSYVIGDSWGYCFDKDYNMIADIECLKHVDVENGYLVIGVDEDSLWKLPIYSLDELIEKAEGMK